MNPFTMTLGRTLFFRLLAHAPEELQRETKEDARRVIPALCFTEDDLRQTVARDERWASLSDDEQREAITALLEADEYEDAGTAANEAIARAVARYLQDAFAEKDDKPDARDFTW